MYNLLCASSQNIFTIVIGVASVAFVMWAVSAANPKGLFKKETKAKPSSYNSNDNIAFKEDKSKKIKKEKKIKTAFAAKTEKKEKTYEKKIVKDKNAVIVPIFERNTGEQKPDAALKSAEAETVGTTDIAGATLQEPSFKEPVFKDLFPGDMGKRKTETGIPSKMSDEGDMFSDDELDFIKNQDTGKTKGLFDDFYDDDKTEFNDPSERDEYFGYDDFELRDLNPSITDIGAPSRLSPGFNEQRKRYSRNTGFAGSNENERYLQMFGMTKEEYEKKMFGRSIIMGETLASPKSKKPKN